MTLYRIAWRSLVTDTMGHGQLSAQNLSDLEQIVRGLNREHRYNLHHWIESQDETGFLECIAVSDRTDEEIGAGGEQCGAGAVRAVNHSETRQSTG